MVDEMLNNFSIVVDISYMDAWVSIGAYFIREYPWKRSS